MKGKKAVAALLKPNRPPKNETRAAERQKLEAGTLKAASPGKLVPPGLETINMSKLDHAPSSLPSNAQNSTRIKLSNLAPAPENLRAREGSDTQIPMLADTIAAVGLLVPLHVRAPRDPETQFQVLDGRRRLLALNHLLATGRVDADEEIDCLLVEGDAGAVAAAVLTNTERLALHPADLIEAIGRFRKQRMSVREIAKALGYREVDIKRLEALSSVHPTVLNAMRAGALTLAQVRMIARIKSLSEQEELAARALAGQLWDHDLSNRVTIGRIDTDDPRFPLVGEARYRAAGGKIVADLFDELAPALDAEILHAAWLQRIDPALQRLKNLGVEVYSASDRVWKAPEGCFTLGYVYAQGLPDPKRQAYVEAVARRDNAASRFAEVEPAENAAIDQLADYLEAVLEAGKLGVHQADVVAITVFPEMRGPIGAVLTGRVRNFDDDAQQDQEGGDGELAATAGSLPIPPTQPDPFETPRADVDLDGVGHSLHLRRTDVATRGLVRDLADHPEAAFTLVLAQMFKGIVLRSTRADVSVNACASTLRVTAIDSANAIAQLDGEVHRRLNNWSGAFAESGLRPIPWIETLAAGDRMALLADLAAVSLDLREHSTNGIRHAARAEAVEIAALCKADISARWTPDLAFLGAHSKAQLLEMLGDMGVEDQRTLTLKKPELVNLVGEIAAERRWAPACLDFGASSAISAPIAQGLEEADCGFVPPKCAEGGEPALAAA